MQALQSHKSERKRPHFILDGAPHVAQLQVKEGEDGGKKFYLRKVKIVDPAGIFIEGGSTPATTLARTEVDSRRLPLLDTGSTRINIADWLRNVQDIADDAWRQNRESGFGQTSETPTRSTSLPRATDSPSNSIIQPNSE